MRLLCPRKLYVMKRERVLLGALCALSAIVILLLFLQPPRAPRELKSEGTHVNEPEDDDNHMKQMEMKRRTRYPPRDNMGPCKPLFGTVGIFVAYVKSSMETHYAVAQRSLECYLKTVNYTVFMVDLDNDERVKVACEKHKQLFFRKHCAAAAYLQDVDWMLVLDADTGIANPNHCIEEWIDDRVNIIFYERFFNWEIASGNYIARNSPFTLQFLRKWADWEFIQPSNWNGADNGCLQMHILQTVLPGAIQEIRVCDHIWHQGKDYDTYMAYVTCIKIALGATRIWENKLRVLRRGHGWVRDGFLTSDQFCDSDFMLHGWKAQNVDIGGWQSPFKRILDPSKCGNGYEGWEYREGKKTNVERIKTLLRDFERSTGRSYPQKARAIPYLTLPDIGDCYPHCDDFT